MNFKCSDAGIIMYASQMSVIFGTVVLGHHFVS